MDKALYLIGGLLAGYGAAWLVSTSRGYPSGATSPFNPTYAGGMQPQYPLQPTQTLYGTAPTPNFAPVFGSTQFPSGIPGSTGIINAASQNQYLTGNK